MSKILYVDFDPESAAGQMKLSGIRRRLSFGGMDVVPLPMSMSRPKELAAALARHRPAGCIVECSHGHNDLSPTLFGDLPVVYLDGRSSLYGGKVTKVAHDGAATARAAFKELLKTRPSCLAVVGWRERVFWSSLREKTFVACSREAHVPCRLFRCVGDGNDRGSRLVGWLSRLPSNCGVFATNDQVAQEVLSACVMAGRSVPGDLKVLGVDNVLSVCETCSPTLSSIQIDFEMAGYRAADLLLRRMDGERRGPQRATFGPMLTMHRTSTGGSRHADRTVLKAIEIIRRDDSMARALHRNIAYFVRRAKEEGMNTCLAGESAIVPILIGSDAEAAKISKLLIDQGVFIPPAMYPAVPMGESRMRVTISATHSIEQLETAITALAGIMRSEGLLA